MKRLISIFCVAILIVFLVPLGNVFAEGEEEHPEFDYRNGLLDNPYLIKENTFPKEVYDNNLNTFDSSGILYYIEFNTFVDIEGAYVNYGKNSNIITFVFLNEETKEIDRIKLSIRGGDSGYIDLDIKNVIRIERASNTSQGEIYELDFFGTYDLDIPVPELPDEIKDIQYEVTTNKATFIYNLPSDEDFSHVNVYFNNEVYQTTDTTFILENLAPNTDYEITFKTVNTEGIESLGTTVNFKTDDLPPPPPIEETDIHNLKAEVSADRVDLSWNNPKTDKFEKAIIYRSTLTSNQQTSFLDYFKPLTIHADELKPIFETNGTTFADLTIQPEQQYQYKVTAIIEGKETEGATVTTDPIPTPPPPPPFELKEVELPFTASNIIKSAFEFIGLFGAFILLALAIRLTPRLVKLIRRSSANRSRAR